LFKKNTKYDYGEILTWLRRKTYWGCNVGVAGGGRDKLQENWQCGKG